MRFRVKIKQNVRNYYFIVMCTHSGDDVLRHDFSDDAMFALS